MNSGAGDPLFGWTSEKGESAFGIAEVLAEQNEVNSSTLHFIKSTKHLVDTIDTRKFAVEEVTVIYLSFTNIRISIAVPGGGVSLAGGANGTGSRKQPPPLS
jgi:hypothetical protein